MFKLSPGRCLRLDRSLARRHVSGDWFYLLYTNSTLYASPLPSVLVDYSRPLPVSDMLCTPCRKPCTPFLPPRHLSSVLSCESAVSGLYSTLRLQQPNFNVLVYILKHVLFTVPYHPSCFLSSWVSLSAPFVLPLHAVYLRSPFVRPPLRSSLSWYIVCNITSVC
jgi:hypothetical protein